ncbi:hypothetical protein [Luteimonas deserti]|uniref:Flagellar protein FliT n=1 Tax=Luteimonas deserti TaxID=2752306 RepID=A0A7Z0TXE7_9GAMM|nr:hypothetical protein [Luteimonas deserti]NYZ64354.1 hypothetical protein [Luteimonas deserti]
MSDAGQPALEAQLSALGSAVEAGELAEAAERMAEYDASLRRYIERTAPDTPVDGLRALLRMQNEVLLQMRGKQQAIGEALRQAYRQGNASRAYTSAETTP